MKLRVRPINSKQTLKIEVPTNCSINQFKQTLSLFISCSSPLSIHISLNGKDELSASSSLNNDITLLSQLGVISGDLIFYTLTPNFFNPPPQTLVLKEKTRLSQIDVESEMGLGQFVEFEKLGQSSCLGGTKLLDSEVGGTPFDKYETLGEEDSLVGHKELMDSEMGMSNFGEIETLEQSTCLGGTKLLGSEISGTNLDKYETFVEEDPLVKKQKLRYSDDMSETEGEVNFVNTVENMDIGEGTEELGSNKRVLSVPYLLRKVSKDEMLNDCCDLRLMVIGMHAVLLESGFVGFELATGNRVDRFPITKEWTSTGFTVWYTLPELIGCKSNNNICETVVIKFHSLGQCVSAYGSLAKNGTGTHGVRLDGNRFVPTLYTVLGNSNSDFEVSGNEGGELYEFWKIVKDGLALPLLIDICDRAGFLPPPCLMRLPTELKVKILELLPSVDLAKVCCVSSELRYLCSNNDIWKQKYAEEFGGIVEYGTVNWRERFASMWKSRKPQRSRISYIPVGRLHIRRFPGRRSFYDPIICGDPSPSGVPRIVGGEHDLIPGGFGDPAPVGFPAFTGDDDFWPGLRFPSHLRRLG